MKIRFSIRKRSTCWLCYVWIENSYNTCVKSNTSWVVKFQRNISIGGLGYETQPTLNSGKQFWKRVLFFWSKFKLRRFSSRFLDSGNIYTAHNQQLHWDVLRCWWLNLSLSFSLFIPIFCVLPVSLRDCLYREKDVGGGLCHGHISHLVHLKTLLVDRLEHAKKDRKISQTPCPMR